MPRALLALVGLGLFGCAHGPLMTGNSANSSAESGASSRASADLSGTSGRSSQSSAASSANSADLSASSNQSSVSSQASSASSANSNQSSATSSQSSQGSAATSQSSNQSFGNSSGSSGGAASSVIVAGSALLSSVAGGIVLTVYASRRRAQPQAMQQLQPQSHQPVQRLPGPEEPVVPPPPMQPFEPAPYPQPEPLEPQPYPQPMEPEPWPTSRRPAWEPPLDAMVLARAWLTANELQLKQDLALGAGPTLEDLAGIARIAPQRRARFYRLLQRHHAELVPPAEMTLVEAAEVMSRVGELVLADPVLKVDGEAVALAP